MWDSSGILPTNVLAWGSLGISYDNRNSMDHALGKRQAGCIHPWCLSMQHL